MAEEGKVEPTDEKEDLEVVEDQKENPEGENLGLPKEGDLGKEEDELKEDAEGEYRRKSFHAKPYKSETIEQTQKEVDAMIVKKTRYIEICLVILKKDH